MARIKHGTLVANVVTAVELAVDSGRVEVAHIAGSAPIYVRQGTDPTVAGDDCEVVPVRSALTVASKGAAPLNIRLISADAATYSVRAV